MTDHAFEPVHLSNYVDDVEVGHRVVAFEGHLWYVKPVADLRVLGRELLAATLGAGVLNVVETRRVSGSTELICWDGSRWSPESQYELIARLVDSYALSDLSIADVDRAVAFELVFSLWIRRRDTHAGNRAYVGGIPMFFDHGVAFDGEPGYQAIERFLDPTEDAGHAGRWRMRLLAPGQAINLPNLREDQRDTQLATHYVRDVERAHAAMNDAVDWIVGLPEQHIRETAERTLLVPGQATAVADLLLATQSTLRADIELVRQVLALPS